MAQPSKSYRGATTPAPPAPAAQPEPPKVIEITSPEELTKQLDEARNKIVLLEFFATWCGPCRTIAKQLDELAVTYEGKAVILKVDVDDHEEVAMAYEVTSMPTFMIFQKKRKLEVFTGSKFERVIEGMAKYCGVPEGSADKEEETAQGGGAAPAAGAPSGGTADNVKK